MKENKKRKASGNRTGRTRKMFITFLVSCTVIAVFIFISFVGINLYVRGSVQSRIVDESKAGGLRDMDCILVLGASVVNGDTPSHMLRDRLDKAISLYFAGCAPKIIMSGDHGGEYYNEVQVMKDYAISKGVPSEDIFMDHAGFSTYESMYRAQSIFGVESMIVVTQEYHLYRAVYVAAYLGVDVYGVAADENQYSGQLKRDIREYLAVVKDFCQVIIKPEPKLLGASVDLSGSGDVTNDRD